MQYTPSAAAERTALAWQRSALALAIVAALLLRHGRWPTIAAGAALAACAALAARRQLSCRNLAIGTVGAAVMAALVVIVA